MKKQLQKKYAAFIILSMMFLGNAHAQWGVNGTHIYNTNTGKVGIGIGAVTIPAGTLTVKGSGGVPVASWVAAGAPLFVGFGETAIGNADYILNMAAAAANARPVFIGRRSRGTLAAPTVVANNDFIMSFLSSGYDGAAFQNPAGIDFYVDGVPAAGSIPARISFVTGANSATRAERLKILSGGDVTVTTGNLNMNSASKSIQFALPVVGGAAMMSMFPSGTANSDRMVLSHSLAYPNWGLQYQDTADKFNFLSGGTPVLTTDLGSQNVGIGNSSPTSRLHVVGNAAATSPVVEVANTYVGSVDVRGINSLSKAADGYGYGVYGTGGYMGAYLTADAGAYTGSGFGVYGYASGTAGTRYGVYGTASGGADNWGGFFPTKTYTNDLRVGGTQGATGFVASINGKLIATEIRVQPQASWPDYVFGNDHILMSLEELEASINANKHLPGIPSAADVKDNGIMVGEMQSKAIEKIEENTLYILQLNKKVKEVEQLNSTKSKEMDLLNSKIKELEQKIEALTKLIK